VMGQISYQGQAMGHFNYQHLENKGVL